MQVLGMMSDTCTVLSVLLFCSCFVIKFFSNRFVNSGLLRIVIAIFILPRQIDIRLVGSLPHIVFLQYIVNSKVNQLFLKHISTLVDNARLSSALVFPLFNTFYFSDCNFIRFNIWWLNVAEQRSVPSVHMGSLLAVLVCKFSLQSCRTFFQVCRQNIVAHYIVYCKPTSY